MVKNQPSESSVEQSQTTHSPEAEPRVSPISREGHQPDVSGQSNITIGHLEVYNFPTQVEQSWPGRSFSQRSPYCCHNYSSSSSGGPICRICHEGDSAESLLAPCNCMGTIALVHVSCMERWLSSTETDSCELCHYKFKTSRIPRPFLDFVFHWLRGPSIPTQQRSMIGDMICLCLLTPIAVASVCLCLDGALQQFLEGSQMEAGCLLGLSTILAFIYIAWLSVTIRYYYRNYRQWQQNNQDVHILPRRSQSSPAGRTVPSPITHRNGIQDIPTVVRMHSPGLSTAATDSPATSVFVRSPASPCTE